MKAFQVMKKLTRNVLQKIYKPVTELQQQQASEIRATLGQALSTETAFDEALQTAC